jgi:hypothetical protein
MTIVPAFDKVAQHEVAAAVRAVAAAMEVLFARAPDHFAEREKLAVLVLQEGGRVALQAELQRIEDALPAAVAVGRDETAYAEHQPGRGEYLSLFGKLEPSRRTFRQVGVRNGPTIVPLELIAGITEGATPAFAFNIILGYGMHELRSHLELLESAGRYAPPRATAERLAVRLAARVHEHLPKVEPLVRAAERVPEAARAIAVGLDRGSAPMAEPRAAGAPKAPRRRRTKPRVRAIPTPIDVNFRMAYVGTVSFLDEHGDTLEVRRYAGPAGDPPELLCGRMAEDVRMAMRQRPDLIVEVVQDAAPEMWNLVRAALLPLRRPDCLTAYFEAIDMPHAIEHLADALLAVTNDAAVRAATLDRWRGALMARDSAIDDIERELTSYRAVCEATSAEALDAELVYITNNKDRLRYAKLLRRRLIIGSGTTESAAKTVINHRAKGAGQRWTERGLRGVLAARSLAHSSRLPAFWVHFSRLYVANVVCAPDFVTTTRQAA